VSVLDAGADGGGANGAGDAAHGGAHGVGDAHVGTAAVASDARWDLYDLSLAELTEFCGQLGEKPFRARQLYAWMYRQGAADFSEMTDLPRAAREKLTRAARLDALIPAGAATVATDASAGAATPADAAVLAGAAAPAAVAAGAGGGGSASNSS